MLMQVKARDCHCRDLFVVDVVVVKLAASWGLIQVIARVAESIAVRRR